jgi:hypothetical protein
MALPTGCDDPHLVPLGDKAIHELLKSKLDATNRWWIGFSYEADFHAFRGLLVY